MVREKREERKEERWKEIEKKNEEEEEKESERINTVTLTPILTLKFHNKRRTINGIIPFVVLFFVRFPFNTQRITLTAE